MGNWTSWSNKAGCYCSELLLDVWGQCGNEFAWKWNLTLLNGKGETAEETATEILKIVRQFNMAFLGNNTNNKLWRPECWGRSMSTPKLKYSVHQKKDQRALVNFFGQQHNKSVGHRVAVHASCVNECWQFMCFWNPAFFWRKMCPARNVQRPPARPGLYMVTRKYSVAWLKRLKALTAVLWSHRDREMLGQNWQWSNI